jgi:hypothetical protein
LHQNGHAQARILGLLATAAKPTWLGLLASEPLTLRSLRAIDEPAFPLIKPLGAQLSGPPRFEAAEIRRHLRVFQGGK